MTPGPVPRKNSPLAVPRSKPLVTGAKLYAQQFAALTHQKFLVRSRAWKSNLLLLAQAVLFILLIWLINQAMEASRKSLPAFSSVEHPTPVPVGAIPLCTSSMFLRQDAPCVTLAWSPQSAAHGAEVIQQVAANNDPPIPASQLMAFTDADAMDQYMLEHPDTVLSAVEFDPDPLAGAMADFSIDRASAPARRLGYTIQTNSTVQWFKGQFQNPNTYVQLPLQVAIERELVRYMANNPDTPWEVSITAFPHTAAPLSSLIGSVAPTFLLASIMFQFVLLLHDVAQEKESGARRAMACMGLRDAPYWASWFLWQGALAVLEGSLLVGFGYAFQFPLFKTNSFWLSYLLVVLVSLSVTSLGFLLSMFIRKTGSAVPVGFIVFVIAWIFLIVIAFGFPYASQHSLGGIVVFSVFPWSLLAKGISDLATASAATPTPGIAWAQRNDYCVDGKLSPMQLSSDLFYQQDCVMPVGTMFWVLALQIGGFFLVALWLDNVLPDANGVRRSPWYFLTPSYWFASRKQSVGPARRALAAPSESDQGLSVDVDVAAEAAAIRRRCREWVDGKPAAGSQPPAHAQSDGLVKQHSAAAPQDPIYLVANAASQSTMPPKNAHGLDGTPADKPAASPTLQSTPSSSSSNPARRPADSQFAVEMFGLRRAFGAGWTRRAKKRQFVAVRGSWLGIRQGECFCLLGPNGAGKTTTINCLTGVLPLSAGDALVCGQSIATAGGMDRIRPTMGVCPQFDVLWDALSGREHLRLFAALKGLPRAAWRPEAEQLLEQVRLLEAGDVLAGRYSGGMRRRLSVACALLGDPRVVYLDEPTTGLDPISRRHLWDLIDRTKRERAVVLTTHSMEEADILGDRIAIMARGRLRCMGTALHLKAKFGSGYRVSVRVSARDPIDGPETSGDPQSSVEIQELEEQLSEAHGTLSQSAETPSTARPPAISSPPPPPSVAPLTEVGAAAPCTPTPAQAGRAKAAKNRQPTAAVKRSRGGAVHACRVKAIFMEHLGASPADESTDYIYFMCPYEYESKLSHLLQYLKARQDYVGVEDIQLRLTPLEDVFLAVTRKAELENAQAEGKSENLTLEEEGIAIKVPLGAELIESPSGAIYHVRWVQDEEGSLQLLEYWRDPITDLAAAQLQKRSKTSTSVDARP